MYWIYNIIKLLLCQSLHFYCLFPRHLLFIPFLSFIFLLTAPPIASVSALHTNTSRSSVPEPPPYPPAGKYSDKYPPTWHQDKNGCAIQSRIYRRGMTALWKGQCRDGKAHGYGSIVWYKYGLEYNTEIISERAGLTMVAGKRTLSDFAINTISGLQYEILNCTGRRSDNTHAHKKRSIKFFVPNAFPFHEALIFGAILKRGAQIMWRRCHAEVRGTPVYHGVGVSLWNFNLIAGSNTRTHEWYRGSATLALNKTGRDKQHKAIWNDWKNEDAIRWYKDGGKNYSAASHKIRELVREKRWRTVKTVFGLIVLVFFLVIGAFLVMPVYRLLVGTVVGTLKILHYVFVPHRANRALRTSEDIQPKAVARSMYHGKVTEPPPVYQSENFARKAEALDDRLQAEIDLMETAILRLRRRRELEDEKKRSK